MPFWSLERCDFEEDGDASITTKMYLFKVIDLLDNSDESPSEQNLLFKFNHPRLTK